MAELQKAERVRIDPELLENSRKHDEMIVLIGNGSTDKGPVNAVIKSPSTMTHTLNLNSDEYKRK
jgi:hypothetical protein